MVDDQHFAPLWRGFCWPELGPKKLMISAARCRIQRGFRDVIH
uniref:Uncharacterized protein n=1 Tax=uncultured alpha proteobacterium HF0130_06E21 TaxID=710808 RepID=E0XSZ2_9PROT|nr:hypothetical protein [uncultured alpha proteobacterium HF0130_06E21]